MIVHTEAVVLKRFPFGETSMIARCFTREEGKVSVIIRGAKKKKPHYTSFFQPINYLDLIYHFKPKRDKLKGHPTRKYESLIRFMLRINSGVKRTDGLV